jgi:DNA-binding CsgD family transcriptional regulator
MTQEELQRLLGRAQESNLHSELDVLSERELEVFSALAQGYSGSQILAECGIAPAELRQLKQKIQQKLGLKNEVQLLQRAIGSLKS